MKLKNKRVLVVGLAVTGVPLVESLCKLGARVIINDIKSKIELKDNLDQLSGLEFDTILGGHPKDLEELGPLDLIVLSPGIDLKNPFVRALKKLNVEIIGEIELAYRLTKAVIIAITGTNGKTTTTALVGEIFKKAGINAPVVGNIGIPAISQALDTNKGDVMIMETSSFQLESIVDFHPKIAVLLNLTPDHLNRHRTYANYIKEKFKIFKNQDYNDFSIINYDDKQCREASHGLAGKRIFFSRRVLLDEGVFVENDGIIYADKGEKHKIIDINDIKIPGKHNLENALAATAIALIYGIRADYIRNALKNFEGVEHRIEYVATHGGVRFINDSKATNIDASIKAIEAIDNSIILLAGGLDKGSQFHQLINSFQTRVKALFVYGETASKLVKASEDLGFENVTMVKDLEEAVLNAYALGDIGDTILFSPACASWDMYRNFEERGNHFKEIVRNIRRAKNGEKESL